MNRPKITVVGAGYVGLSNAVLLAQRCDVTVLDISEDRIEQLNRRESPLSDPELEHYLANVSLSLRGTVDAQEALAGADFVVVATPTDYDPDTNYFDTTSVESVIAQAREINRTASIVVKSTIPVGFVEKIRTQFDTDMIFFSPEFLREGRALYDNLHPSRVIVGDQSDAARQFADLLVEGALEEEIEVLFVGPQEAEAIKLFANNYLAMRVAYFNELDSFAMAKGLDSSQIIKGISLDPRIGDYYNNPSFGYGGYCLPKDTKQLLANYVDIPQNLIAAVIDANRTRKDFLAQQIAVMKPRVVGVYRLVMKAGSDNYRYSSILSIVRRLQERNIEIRVYEPTLDADQFMGIEVMRDLDRFKAVVDLIIANRSAEELADVEAKVFTRDLFGHD